MQRLPTTGLRGKSAIALLALCLIALVPAGLLAWQAVESIQRHFATAYVEQFTLQHKHRILAPVSRELALSQRMANSVVTRDWLANEGNPELRERFFREAGQMRREFSAGAWFVVVHGSGNYYFGSEEEPDRQTPRYQLDADNPEDAWYYNTVADEAPYNLNVDLDRELGITNVWINVAVRDNGRPLGVTGTGLELTGFLEDFILDEAPGITPMIVNRQGALQAHPDPERIAYRSGALAETRTIDRSRTIQGLLDSPEDREAVMTALATSAQNSGAETLWVNLEGRPQLLALGHLPELDWHVATALDPSVAQVFEEAWLWPLFIGLLLILALLVAAFVYATDRLILAPLGQLKESARQVAAGEFRSELPAHRKDEIGDLSRTFASMARQVERHTADLEKKVRERTRELEATNARMAEAHGKISDSIEYASIIQRAILPDAEMNAKLEDSCGVLWKPRDTVGGDFYVFRSTDTGYLLGVVDCAGHGVPGSLMTMLARAMIDNAILSVGEDDPGGILGEVDRQIRLTLPREQLPSGISTNMDIGLAWVEPNAGRLRFAGAGMVLYSSDGERTDILTGSTRAIGNRRQGHFENVETDLQPGRTYCLCTDGFPDQAGGERGFGYGDQRFRDLLRQHAKRPLDDQIAAFERALREYQGDLPQRDDITVLTFRFADDRLGGMRSG